MFTVQNTERRSVRAARSKTNTDAGLENIHETLHILCNMSYSREQYLGSLIRRLLLCYWQMPHHRG